MLIDFEVCLHEAKIHKSLLGELSKHSWSH